MRNTKQNFFKKIQYLGCQFRKSKFYELSKDLSLNTKFISFICALHIQPKGHSSYACVFTSTHAMK